MLKKNNHKISGALIWNLPCGVTCPGKTEDCQKFCYANNAEVTWSRVVRAKRFRNFIDALKDDFVKKVVDEVNKSRCRFVRIHESGDFFSQSYLNKWVEIAEACPHVSFYSYTKSYQLDFSKAIKLPNFAIRYSVDASTKHKLDGLPLAVTSVKQPENTMQCLASMAILGGSGKCIRECSFCTRKKGDVWFPPHGTTRRYVR